MCKCKVIAVTNQKGGVGKTTTTENVAIGLSRQGFDVLIVDFDPQGDLTSCLGWKNNDALEHSVSSMLDDYINDNDIDYDSLILHHEEDVDLIPANIELADFEMRLVSVINREQTLSNCIEPLRDKYDYIFIDCPPSLGMLTVNALSAADEVLIPVQTQYLPAKGMTKLLQTVTKIKQKKDNESFSPRPISPIEKPVIYISGIFDSIHNSLISLNLKFYLKEAGYNSKIMTYNKNLKYSNDIIFDSSFLEKPEKLYFTQYKLYEQIKRLDDDMNVDLIIVQVPGGFSQLNNYVFNDFGIYFAFLNNLIRPDYLIVSLPYDFIDRDMVKEIEDVSESKYNKKIDAFVVNNGYWRFGEGTTLSSQPKDTYLPFSLLDSIKEDNMYTINYSELVDSIINVLGEYDDR